jgi:hypothetical protein
MEARFILPVIVIMMPFVVLGVYLLGPGNKAIWYFIPRFLADKEWPRVIIRQAGAGCVFLTLWLIGIAASVCSTVDFKVLEKMVWLMAVLCFVIPIVAVIFFCVGFYYLVIGVFARADRVRPAFQSIFSADKANAGLYVRKLRFYTVLNLSFLAAGVLSISACVVFSKYVGDKLIIFNVLFLIGFIMTMWRIRAYVTKVAVVMELPTKEYFLSTLLNPILVWIHAFMLIKKYGAEGPFLPQETQRFLSADDTDIRGYMTHEEKRKHEVFRQG